MGPVTFAVGTVATDDTGQVAGNTLWRGLQSYEWKASATGYYNARVIEYGYILDYYNQHGSCPPGQAVSCKWRRHRN